VKHAIWIIGAFIAGIGLLAEAQETTVMPPPGAVFPAPSAATGDDTVHAGKAPKSGANPFFSLLGNSSKTNNAGGASTNGMTITSDRIEYDYKELVIAFDAHVRVVDPRFTMTCDRMLVFLEGTNQIKRIICIGNVDGTQPDRHATCNKAVYEHDTGEIVMTGNPVLTRGADRVVGTKITVYQNDQRMVVDGGRMNLSPETMKNREIKP
jgi:lipopolysaccharide transport protein LptA